MVGIGAGSQSHWGCLQSNILASRTVKAGSADDSPAGKADCTPLNFGESEGFE